MPPVSVIPDEEAVLLGRLVDRHYAGVFAYVSHLLGERTVAQDVAHQVFLPRRGDRRRLARAADPRAWLYRRATELACSQLAGCDARPWWQRWQGEPVKQAASQPDELRWGRPGPLLTALAALSFRQRAALLLYGHHGLSLAETAACLGVGPAALNRLLNSARQTVAAIYEAAGRDTAAPQPAALAGPDHEQVRAWLPDYAGLPAAQQAATRTHAASCPACAAQLALYVRIDHDLATMPDAWASRHAQERLLAAVKAPVEETAPAQRPRPLRGLALLALIAVLVVAGAWLGGQVRLAPAVAAGGRRATATPQPAVAAPTSTSAAATAPAASATITQPLPAGMTGEDLAWLRQNAIPFNTTEPGSSSPADLVPIKSMIGSARIVALADSSYGTQQLFGVKQRLLEFLVEQMNFNVLAIDSSWPQAELLNGYIQTGQGDPERLALLLTGGYRQSPDMLETAQWLRAHNQDPLGIPKVAVHGFDILQTYSHIPMDSLLPYLQKVDPEAVPLLQASDQELFQHIVANRADYVSQSSYPEFNAALRNARALVQYDTFAATGDPAARALLRDQFIAENVLAMLRGTAGGNRIVLWGHAADLGVDNQAGNLGAILRQRFGSNYYVINLDFYQGTLSASTARPTGTPEPNQIHRSGPPPAGSYEDYLHLAGLPRFMLDLRPARPAGAEVMPPAALTGLPPYLYRGGGGFPGAAPYPGSGTPGPGAFRRDGSGLNPADPGGGAAPFARGTGSAFGRRAGADAAPAAATPEPTPGEPPAGTAWLQGPHLAHSIPGVFNDCAPEAQFSELRLAELFDAVIFVQDVSPAPMLFQTPATASAQCPAAATPAPTP